MSASPAIDTSASPLVITAYQQRVLSTPESSDLVLAGGRGGGKSTAGAQLALRHIEMYGRDARVLYLRKTQKGCEDFIALTRSLFGGIYQRGASFNANE